MPLVAKGVRILSRVKPRKMAKKSFTNLLMMPTGSYRVVTILAFAALLYLVYADLSSDVSSFSSAFLGRGEVLRGLPTQGNNANATSDQVPGSLQNTEEEGDEKDPLGRGEVLRGLPTQGDNGNATSGQVAGLLQNTEEEDDEQDPLVPPPKASKKERIEWFRKKLPELEILNSTRKSRRFHGRVVELFRNNCSAQFFMVWLSPAKTFGPRELLAVDTLFTTNPDACLVILSNSLDSPKGYNILKPLHDQGFKILAVTPDIPFLVHNTPAESWLKKLKSGKMDPGSIPLFMNLSDLTRLAVLYKYGGVYLDTDIIFLNDLRGLRNAIGAQSVDTETGRWTRLNNAVMVFDIYHPLMFEFLHEYATTFDGNRWGYNSPYLVSRVIKRLGNRPEYNLTIFPPEAFYPVNWIKIPMLFRKPATTAEAEWVEKTVNDITTHSYILHLWNKITRHMKIEEGSGMHRLISAHCTICQNITNSHA